MSAPIYCDEKAAESVFQQFKHVKPRLNKAAIELLCTAYEAAKSEQPVELSQIDWSNVGISIDVSTDDSDAGRRAFSEGPPVEIMENKGGKMLLFTGYLNDKLPVREIVEESDLNKCPKCGGPADNGHDRCHPPSPYLCTKCTAELVRRWNRIAYG